MATERNPHSLTFCLQSEWEPLRKQRVRESEMHLSDHNEVRKFLQVFLTYDILGEKPFLEPSSGEGHIFRTIPHLVEGSYQDLAAACDLSRRLEHELFF